jgi:hypothetical protein
MNAENCPYPLVEHRVEAPQPNGMWPTTRTVVLLECPDAACVGDKGAHQRRLPCAWSWPFAHGRKFNGQSFPRRRCPHCEHIRRAGMPDQVVVEAVGGLVGYG